MPAFDNVVDPSQLQGNQPSWRPPAEAQPGQAPAPAPAPTAGLQGPGGAPGQAAAVQSHWAEDAGPQSGRGLLGGGGDHNTEELTAALDKPEGEHDAKAEEAAAPKPEVAAKAGTENGPPTATAAAATTTTPHAAAPATTTPASQAPATPAPDLTIGDTAGNKRTFTEKVYQHNLAGVSGAKVNVTGAEMKGDLALFKKNWEKNHGRYEAVSAQTGVPAKLIAAIHWRESTGNFNTYLHQGDPLGKPAVHWPRNIPIFYKWEDAAVHALNMKKGIKNDLGMTAKTTDLAAMATYAECYNGLGYYNHGHTSPYVYSGTDKYTKGKYVGDGIYDGNVKDRQLGVLTMLESISTGVAAPSQTPSTAAPTKTPGASPAEQGPVSHNSADLRMMRRGETGDDVKAMQELLVQLGAHLQPDGDFGPATESAVRDFQRKHGLDPDGMIGPGTRAALSKAAAALKPAAPTATAAAAPAAAPAAPAAAAPAPAHT